MIDEALHTRLSRSGNDHRISLSKMDLIPGTFDPRMLAFPVDFVVVCP